MKKGNLEQDKQELVAIRDKRMEGVLLRLTRDGLPTVKKNTKNFCGLEKRNYISK